MKPIAEDPVVEERLEQLSSPSYRELRAMKKNTNDGAFTNRVLTAFEGVESRVVSDEELRKLHDQWHRGLDHPARHDFGARMGVLRRATYLKDYGVNLASNDENWRLYSNLLRYDDFGDSPDWVEIDRQLGGEGIDRIWDETLNGIVRVLEHQGLGMDVRVMARRLNRKVADLVQTLDHISRESIHVDFEHRNGLAILRPKGWVQVERGLSVVINDKTRAQVLAQMKELERL